MSAEVEADGEDVEVVAEVEEVLEDAVPAEAPVEDEELDGCAGEAAACLVVVLSE